MSNEKPKLHSSPGKAPADASDAPDRSAAPAESGPPVTRNNTGRVKFDDRGNAVWEWALKTGSFATEATGARLKKLDNPTLALAEDAPATAANERVKANPKGVVQGYSPYDSGLLEKTAERPRKTDLRRLSEFYKLRKQASRNNSDDE